MRSSTRTLALLTSASFAIAGCEGGTLSSDGLEIVGDEVAARAEPVRCDPLIARYPINGPHNGGYDRNWWNFQCAPHPGDAPDNSDYGGDHHGNDLFAERGTPVVAPADGVVTRSGVASSTSGNRVSIMDDCGWGYYMGHLHTIEPGIVPGVRVAAGQRIGTVGNTGTPTSPHVHFNINRDGNYDDDIDPLPWLNRVDHTACGPDPRCAGRGDGSVCAGTMITTCSGGVYSEGDCAAYGTTCGPGGASARCLPHLDAVYVGAEGFQGSANITVEAGGEVHGCLVYRNLGAWGFEPGTTKLGTTMPRDRSSVAPGSDWLGPNRLATVSAHTDSGDEGRFCFAIRGTDTPGTREEHFSLVNEGLMWAADVGGVADEVNVVYVTTVPRGMMMPAVTPDADVTARRTATAASLDRSPHDLASGGMEASCAAAGPPARESSSTGPAWIVVALLGTLVRRARARSRIERGAVT